MGAGVAALVDQRYRLSSLIGKGGMGEIWVATDTRLRRDVAVKLLRGDLAGDPSLRRRFEQEARLAAQVGHHNIVTIFDVGEDGGVPYIVMERLPGRTLADAIAAGPLDEATVRRVASQVLDALQAAHAAGVLHRDIKPSNVLLAADGTAKVADFGIAKAVEAADVTLTGTVLGTPAYLAPERIHGARATESADIYAVGVLMYEMLTGSKPFEAATPFALYEAISGDSVSPITELRSDVSQGIAAIVATAMARDPGKRFRSAAAMRDALMTSRHAALDPATAATEPAIRPPRVDRTERLAPAAAPPRPRSRARRRGPVLAGAVIVAVLVTVAVGIGRHDSRSAKSSPPATTTVSSGHITSSSVPPALARALDELDKAITP
jgi:non-specific serine/threonine protein kinase/serine/threonine-protein kinase